MVVLISTGSFFQLSFFESVVNDFDVDGFGLLTDGSLGSCCRPVKSLSGRTAAGSIPAAKHFCNRQARHELRSSELYCLI